MDRLLSVEIANFRSIEALNVEVDGLKVLIGENGGGKSSIIECFEILRCASQHQFVETLERVHGGHRAMGRGLRPISLSASIAIDDEVFAYKVGFGGQPGWGTSLQYERLSSNTGKAPLIHRVLGRRQADSLSEPGLDNLPQDVNQLGLPFARGHLIADRVRSVLEGIEVHLAHEVSALWRQRERSRSGSTGGLSGTLREPAQLSAGKQLEHGATNLASVFHGLKNGSRDDWELTRALVKLGLGDDIDDVSVPVVAESGYATLSLLYSDGRQVPAMAMSDGQLSYLSFVALVRSNVHRSVLLVDEPEIHLHPGLVVRVLDLLDSAAAKSPVIIATHSNEILDALEHPNRDVRIVSQVRGATTIEKLDSGFLEQWRTKPLSELRRSMGDSQLKGSS